MMKMTYPISRLSGSTLKLGEYKIDINKPVSKANLSIEGGFVYGIPTSIESEGILYRTKDRISETKGLYINYRVELPQDALDVLVQWLNTIELKGGLNPWISQYSLVLKVSDRNVVERGGETVEIRAFYRGLDIIDASNRVLAKHRTRRRGKNRKHYR